MGRSVGNWGFPPGEESNPLPYVLLICSKTALLIPKQKAPEGASY
jgi:hypothetical protein